MDLDTKIALGIINQIQVSDELKDKLSESLSRIKYWKANDRVHGSHVELGPYKRADVETANGTVPVYSLRRTIANQPANRQRIIYEVIHIEVDADDEPSPNFYKV